MSSRGSDQSSAFCNGSLAVGRRQERDRRAQPLQQPFERTNIESGGPLSRVLDPVGLVVGPCQDAAVGRFGRLRSARREGVLSRAAGPGFSGRLDHARNRVCLGQQLHAVLCVWVADEGVLPSGRRFRRRPDGSGVDDIEDRARTLDGYVQCLLACSDPQSQADRGISDRRTPVPDRHRARGAKAGPAGADVVEAGVGCMAGRAQAPSAIQVALINSRRRAMVLRAQPRRRAISSLV